MAAKKPVRGRAAKKPAAPAKTSKQAKSTAKAKPAKALQRSTSSKTAAPKAASGKAAKGNRAATTKATSKAKGRAKPNVKTSSKTAAAAKAKARPAKAAKPAPKGKAAPKAKASKVAAKAPAKAAGKAATAKAPAKKTANRAAAPSPAPQPVAKSPAARKGDDGKSYSRLEHIDDATLDHIIARLDEMRAESLAVVNVKKGESGGISEEADVGDDMDLASQDRDREFSLLMHERHLRRLLQIDEAYERIREGTYGLCEGTDEPINPKRLLIMPLARYSIEYQQQQEKMLGRTPEDSYFEEEAAIDNEDE